MRKRIDPKVIDLDADLRAGIALRDAVERSIAAIDQKRQACDAALREYHDAVDRFIAAAHVAAGAPVLAALRDNPGLDLIDGPAGGARR